MTRTRVWLALHSIGIGIGLAAGCSSASDMSTGAMFSPAPSSSGAGSPAPVKNNATAGTRASSLGSMAAAAGGVSNATATQPARGSTTTQPASTAGAAGSGGAVTVAGGAAGVSGHAGDSAVAGSAASAGSEMAGGAAGAAGAMAMQGGASSDITGTLGQLGPVQPIMAGWATTNGLETLVYLSSAPLTCEQMMTKGSRWLGKLPAGSQVIEIVVGQPAAVKSYTIGTPAAFGGGEVNYAEGSKSSSTEVTGSAGSITFTVAEAKGAHDGSIDVSAPFKASGQFHAQWCEGGTEY